jgi:uncharacterized MAPEG superfamily protein
MTESVQAASVVFALLYLKYLVCNVITGRLKRQLGGGPPEDRRGQAEAPAPNEALKAKYERWSNICNNDAENLPLGTIAMFMSAFVVAATGNVDAIRVQIAFSALWGILRFAHTLVYARGWQPARSIVFTLGVICSFVQVALLVVASFFLLFRF